MGKQIEVKVPDIGDFKDVEIIEILVKPGDVIQKETSLISLESDKATMEIPSSDAGTVKEIKVKIGDKLNQGAVILLLDAADSNESAKPAAAGTPAPSAAKTAAPAVSAAVAASPAPASAAKTQPAAGKADIETEVLVLGS